MRDDKGRLAKDFYPAINLVAAGGVSCFEEDSAEQNLSSCLASVSSKSSVVLSPRFIIALARLPRKRFHRDAS